MKFAFLLVLSFIFPAAQAIAGDWHTLPHRSMFSIGTGVEGSTASNDPDPNVLIRAHVRLGNESWLKECADGVCSNAGIYVLTVRGEMACGDSTVPLLGTGAEFPCPYARLRVTLAELDVYAPSDLERARGWASLGFRFATVDIRRDIRIGMDQNLQGHVLGAWFNFGRQVDESELAFFLNTSLDLIGGYANTMTGPAVIPGDRNLTVTGFSFGTLAVEAGLRIDTRGAVQLEFIGGGRANLAYVEGPRQSIFDPNNGVQSNPEVFAELRIDIARYLRIFGRVAYNWHIDTSGTQWNMEAFQYQAGAEARL